MAVLAAQLGGSAGVAIWIAAISAAPVPETARRSGNLLASADNTGQAFVTLLLVPFAAIPPALVVLLGDSEDSALVRWAGIPVGVASGCLIAWGLGAVAIHKLETSGPELLDLLRHGGSRRPSAAPTSPGLAAAPSIWTTPAGLTGKIVLACWTLCWIPLVPQGLVPLAMTLTDNEAKSWFLALYAPNAWQWPVMLGMIALGLGLMGTAVWLTRRSHQLDRAIIGPSTG